MADGAFRISPVEEKILSILVQETASRTESRAEKSVPQKSKKPESALRAIRASIGKML
jgi:hypothetical protein